MSREDQRSLSPTTSQLVSFGREWIDIHPPERCTDHLVSTLERWFDCRGEAQHFKRSELISAAKPISRLAKEIPADLYSFWIDLLQNIPELNAILASTFTPVRKRPGKAFSFPLSMSSG